MSITLEEAAKRIIICGLTEMEDHIREGEIGAIVTACSDSELQKHNDLKAIKKHPFKKESEHDPDRCSGNELIALIDNLDIPRHQSLLYQSSHGIRETLGLTERDVDSMEDGEMSALLDPLNLKRANETFNFIERFFEDGSKNKKIMIHCAHGSDRSAMIAIAFMLRSSKSRISVDDILRQLQKIRPHAILQARPIVFKNILGERYQEFDTATETYGETVELKRTIPSERERLEWHSKGAPEFTCLKTYFDEITRNHKAQSSYYSFVTNCNRFGISIPTWRL